MGQELLLPVDSGFAHDRTDQKDEWMTPPELVAALGRFDLDPCSPVLRPWPTADRHFTVADNGLVKPWSGRVFMNPPYGKETEDWMRRLAEHGRGTALIFARTETGSFFPWVWEHASAVLFIKGRVAFYEFACAVCGRGGSKHKSKLALSDHKFASAAPVVVQGDSAGAPSVLVAYGCEDAEALRAAAGAGVSGKFVALDHKRFDQPIPGGVKQKRQGSLF